MKIISHPLTFRNKAYLTLDAVVMPYDMTHPRTTDKPQRAPLSVALRRVTPCTPTKKPC